jgi:MFS family permease
MDFICSGYTTKRGPPSFHGNFCPAKLGHRAPDRRGTVHGLDGTVIATALPQMADTFGVAAVDLNIGISAYLLTVAVFIPTSGWVTDRFGARLVFASAIATFTIASVLCAASGTLLAFTAARILQGIGGAVMVPSAASSCCATPKSRT